LDVKLVVSDTGNTVYRARIIAKLLEVAGRTDIPVGVGLPQKEETGPQEPWVKGYELSEYPGQVRRDGIDALIETIMSSSEPVTLVCIGPLPNIGEALLRAPEIAARARFVGMHGSIRRSLMGEPRAIAEYNVVSDVRACQKVFQAPWQITITPLDTCGVVVLEGQEYRTVRDSHSPLAQAVIENYRIWTKTHGGDPESRSSILFDTVAVYLAFAEEFLVMESLGIRVTNEGFTVIDPCAKNVRCATEWKDLPAFRRLLVDRLTA
jgi:inosine-uridine nucleoside N-ribohydrolase